MSSHQRQRGFTLLEIILVVLIFGMMSVMAYGGLNSVLKTRSKVQQSLSRTTEFEMAYLRLRNDFQNLRERPIRDSFGDVQPALLGTQEGGVQFTRGGWRNPLYLPRSTMERVAYRLHDGKLERATWRVLDQAQDSQPQRVVLLVDVQQLRWRYMDAQREWVEEWPAQKSSAQTRSQAPPPLAVELTVVTKDWGENRLLFKTGGDLLPPGMTSRTPPPLPPPGDTNPPNPNPGSTLDEDPEPDPGASSRVSE